MPLRWQQLGSEESWWRNSPLTRWSLSQSLGVFDGSDVHVEDGLFEDLTGTTFVVGTSHITIRRNNILNMQVGNDESASAIVDPGDFNT